MARYQLFMIVSESREVAKPKTDNETSALTKEVNFYWFRWFESNLSSNKFGTSYSAKR